MRHPSANSAWSLLACATITLFAGSASGQPSGATGSLERFQPSVPGDAMFGVPSPAIGGHLVPRGTLALDFAYRPLSIQEGSTRSTIVSHQLFLHAGASFALFDLLLFSLDMPFALAQDGDDPTVTGVRFTSPHVAQAGDLRLGVRSRFYGDFWDPFQIGIGAYFYAPTGPNGSYAGDGAVRGEPHLLVGGRFKHFVYSASLGTTVHASARPHSFDIRAGGAWVVGEEVAQIGLELSVSVPFSNDVLVSTPQAQISIATPTSAELLLGARYRPLPFLVVGAGAGPGLTQGWGTPVFFAVGTIGYEPLPPRPDQKPLPPRPDQKKDTDGDGIADDVDACPSVAGVRSDNPKKNGCPPYADTDNDRIPDEDDACPKEPGVKNTDVTKNGCPADADTDRILDKDDACPKEPGVENDDPKKNGCPPDADADGIPDKNDACPKEPGVKNTNVKKNGCPPDTDGDTIFDAKDACPKEPGPPDADPTKNGCPLVIVTKQEIVITRQVRFLFDKSELDQTIDPVSNDLLTEVRDAIVEHPEIDLIEVQGHADDVGNEAYNVSLSQRRADAVRQWLITRGIAQKKLVAKGYGSKAPKAANDSEQGRQENRRVQFIIVQKNKP